ncbi:MAG: NAD(P)H-hydrate dehydratase [Beijerinckiaceae bacterium]
MLDNTPDLWRTALRLPRPEDHKYSRGHCLIVSGPEFRTGAARLAALAALAAGAGAVTIAGNAAALRVHAAHVTAIMLAEAETPDDFARLLVARSFQAAVIGPAAGVGEATLARIDAARVAGVALVLDADALTSLAGKLSRAVGIERCVLTPHEGEFERLFGPVLADDEAFASLTAAERGARPARALAAARLAAGVVVLKGANTVIAAPDGRVVIDHGAGPELASAGTGDVLSGLVGAHLAQGMPAFEAAAAAVWLHGRLASDLSSGLTADRLAASVKPVLAFV